MFFNSVDPWNRTYVHSVTSHEALNGTHTVLSGSMFRTGDLTDYSCTSSPSQALQSESPAQASSSGYSGPQVVGIVLGTLAGAALLAVVTMVAMRRRRLAAQQQYRPQLEQTLLDGDS